METLRVSKICVLQTSMETSNLSAALVVQIGKESGQLLAKVKPIGLQISATMKEVIFFTHV